MRLQCYAIGFKWYAIMYVVEYMHAYICNWLLWNLILETVKGIDATKYPDTGLIKIKKNCYLFPDSCNVNIYKTSTTCLEFPSLFATLNI